MAKTRTACPTTLILSAWLCLALITLLMTLPASAAPEELKWSPVNTPVPGKPGNWVLAKGSDVQLLTMSVDGTLYAYGKGLTYTLYKSTDGGTTWTETGNVKDSLVAIATTPTDANSLYYATTANVYRSTDGGKTFDRLPANLGGAGSSNIEITAVAVTRYNGHNIVAVATRDTDSAQFGGVYWLDEAQVIPAWEDTGLTGHDVYTIAFSPSFATDRQLVAVVTDETTTYVTTRVGGGGWGAAAGNARLTKDNSGSPVAVTISAAIAFPADYEPALANYILFVAINTGSGNGDVYKINGVSGGSSTATDLNIGAAYGLSNVDVTGLAASGNSGTTSLLAGAASSAQVYFSADAGTSWTRSRKEPSGASKTHVLMPPDFNGKAYAATSGTESAFSVSLDSGATWNQTGLIDTDLSAINDLALAPIYSQDNTLFLLTFGGEYSLWRSSNGGAGWERVLNSALPNIDTIDFIEFPPQYGKSSPVVYLAGASSGRAATWKSTNNGQSFICRPATDPTNGTPITINSWAVVNDSTLFIGSYDGSNGLFYATINGGFTYSTGAVVGDQPLTSIALSPNYEQDRTILVGNANGGVYWSQDNGASFTTLPAHATSPPLTSQISVTFDPKFSSNRTVYAASNNAGKGVFRFVIGTSTEWTSIDSSLPGGSLLNQVMVSPEGVLYTANAKAGAGMERSLNPTYSLGPTFETVNRGLSTNAILSGLWWGDGLWAIDTANLSLLTFSDSLTSPVTLSSPADKTAGAGALINNTVSNIVLDWKAISGTTDYQWQINNTSDFSTVPSGFEGTTQATSARLPALEPDTTYYWRVKATGPVASPWSAKWSFTTCLNTVTVALKLENPGAGATDVPLKPVLQWDAVTGATAYELVMARDVNFTDTVITRAGDYALPTTAWESNVSLNYETTYYWKVRAISPNSRSDWSAVSAFTTLPTPPATVAPPLPPPTPSAQPVMLMPTPVSKSLPEPPLSATPPLPPSPPSTIQVLPNWAIYMMGALLFVIILLLAIILTLIIVTRRE